MKILLTKESTVYHSWPTGQVFLW